MRVLFVAFAIALVLLIGGLATYLGHIRSTATELIASAREIRTTQDAEREIAAWKVRAGNDFWTESDHPGGDHNYDASIVNLPIARMRVVEPTVVRVGIAMNGGKLRNVAVIESTGWYPVASVWIQEWFDTDMPNRFHVTNKGRPSRAILEFPSTLPDIERRKAFAVNTACLVKPRGCRSAEDILPDVWQLAPKS
jgi:hypothetical protein